MCTFSQLLQNLRVSDDLRQVELVSYKQSYTSALEVSLKGPPTEEFLQRITSARQLNESEEQKLHAAAEASQRKLVINGNAPADIYWLLHDLQLEIA